MTIQTDSVVLVVIERLNQAGDPYGIRTLVQQCSLADKTISKAIERLEAQRRIRVVRGEPGTRHEYVVLTPPDEVDLLAASIHLAEKNPC
jgi:DNA-binding MarR family transcriptional regulator